MHQTGSIGQGPQQLHELKDVLKTQSHRIKHHRDSVSFFMISRNGSVELTIDVGSYVQRISVGKTLRSPLGCLGEVPHK